MNKKPYNDFFGTSTLGEKGQIVIPAEARKSLRLKKGEKLLIFGMGKDMIVCSKLAQLEKFASRLAKKLTSIHEIIKKTGRAG